MPSYKPRITVYTDEETNEKLAYIARIENRSSSNYTEYLIKRAIKDYEKEHGEITLKSSKEIWNEQMELIKNPTKGILKKSLNNGNRFGDALGREVVEKIKGKQETENQPLD